MAMLFGPVAVASEDASPSVSCDAATAATAAPTAAPIARHDAVDPARCAAAALPHASDVASRAIAGVRSAAVGVWNALVGDDLRTVADPHASASRRVLAGVGLTLDVIPEGKAFELGAKLAARAAESTAARVGEHLAARTSPFFRDVAAEHVRTVDAAVPNAESLARGYQPPWKSGMPVHDGRLLRDDRETFARVYRDVGDDSRTKPLGPWLLRRSDIVGKSPREIKDVFALPYEPTHVAEIRLEAGFRLRVGTSGPNAFGSGGSEQFQTLSQLQEQHLGPTRRLP